MVKHSLLALAFALPHSGYALGLGDIHIASTLHRPFDAYIEVVGARDDDLSKIKASVADPALFQRYGLDRATFLASVTITVEQDKSKGVLLLIHSTEAPVEPIVSLLVDLRSPAGEMVREYTILLDPPGLTSEQKDTGIEPEVAIAATPATPTAPAILTPIAKLSAHPDIDPKVKLIGKPIVRPVVRTHTIARHETLQRIVTRAGAHSSSEQHRMMVAVYRDNPHAFANNLNAMRVGFLLHLPDAAELSAISVGAAEREFAAQMKAWKSLKRGAPRRLRATTRGAASPIADENTAVDTGADSTIALTKKIETLENSLGRMRQELNQPRVVPDVLPAVTQIKPTPSDEKPATPIWNSAMQWPAIVGGSALALALGVWAYRRSRRPAGSTEPFPFLEEPDELIVDDLRALALQRATLASDQRPPDETESSTRTANATAKGGNQVVAPIVSSPHATAIGKTDRPGDTTVVLAIPDVNYEQTIELTLSNFNPEATINTMHVTIPDSLQNQEPLAERRKSPVDVLRQALEREPTRSDLRLKLLELYYVAAAQNRKAFLEIAHQLAKNIHLTSPQEWSQIVDMGRKIASDDPLFVEARDDQAIA